MRWGWILLSPLLCVALSRGEESDSAWRPIGPTSTPVVSSSAAASLGQPRAAATLGQPLTLAKPKLAASNGATTSRAVSPMGEDDPLLNSQPAATLGSINGGKAISGITLGPVDDSPEEAYNWGVITKPWKTTSKAKDSKTSESLGGLFERWELRDDGGDEFGGRGGTFTSETDFETLTSFSTNPFLAEDPRKLTELRPIFLYQTIPNNQYLYRGGSIQSFTLQGRLGIGQNFSIVVHKLGLLVVNPGGLSMLENETGISELWLGPKYTFYRDSELGIIAAGGLIFQLPVGPASVFQDTGDLGLVPYVSGAWKFGSTKYGLFTLMDSFGYNFGTGDARSDFFYNTLHVDYDALALGRVFPFLELNWFHYTKNGGARPFLGFEGRDLANVGAAVSGRDFFTLGFGSRFRFTPAFEVGFSGETPLNGTKDLLDFRFGVDFIFRY